jgi:hypothetical protein
MKFVRMFVACTVGLFAITSDASAEDPFWSLLSPLGTTESRPEAVKGQVFLSVAARHRQVGFLENDIRGIGIVNSDRIVVPRGTPVYRAAFGIERSPAGRQYEGWCAVVRENGGERGYCLLREGSGFVLGLLPRNGSLYLPTRLADYGLRPVTTPEVRVDDTALAHFPAITFSYALGTWRRGGVMLRRSATTNGLNIDLGPHEFERAADGSASFFVGQRRFTIAPAHEGQALTATLATIGVVSPEPSTGAQISDAGNAGVRAQWASPEAQMAETIARVCVAGMRSGEALSVEQFGDQFVFQRTRRGVTWLKEARGQPWVRLAINGSRPGSCSANFSDAGANSIRAATNLLNEIRGMEWRRTVSVTGVSQAFTFPENVAAFDHNQDPYLASLAGAGYQTFFFMPASPDPDRQR